MDKIDAIFRDDPLVRLVQPENFVGWIYGIDYGKALVMTNDLWKSRALGVPHNGFLVAASFDPEHYGKTPVSEREVILLRVIGSSRLPQDDELVQTRIDHYQQQKGAEASRDYDDLTRNQLQFGGLECRVLGTFYLGDKGELSLGSDIESFALAASLKVYRPRGKALGAIVNHQDPMRRAAAREDAERMGLKAAEIPFRIGTVRYTSTARMHRGAEAELVPVFIQPSDLLARRTAVLGMTRTGKSNMVKQTVSVVKRVADESGVKIGQVIYDVNGEYANANQQDKGAIADVYPDQTTRYRLLPAPGFEELRTNFYEQLSEGFGIILRELEDTGQLKGGDYKQTFANLTFDEPDKQEFGEHTSWEVRVAAYRVVLYKAGFAAPAGYKVKFTANQKVREAIDAAAKKTLTDPKDGLTLAEAADWFTWCRVANNATALRSSGGGDWVDDQLKVLMDMIVQKRAGDAFISGYRILAAATKYHTPGRVTDVADEIYKLLVAGRIVILDLSVGPAEIRERIARDVARKIFDASMGIFVDGKAPPNIVVYIEEAHNLIGKDQELTDTWPRLAKEGAKYRIALVYATQEVTSVHASILANTENWFISHLNNEREVKELTRFYDFGDFADSIIRAQDVGFTRVKTLSSPYVIPVQIDKFDPETARQSLSAAAAKAKPIVIDEASPPSKAGA
ncbi:MAG: DUF87 domain-containing protein [Chloroflexota bacterium]